MSSYDPKAEYALLELCHFLTYRLDETHALQQGTSPAPWRYSDVDSIPGGALYDPDRSIAHMHYETPTENDGSIVRLLPVHEADANGHFIAAHDPAAADRDIKAKRRIVANMRTAIDHAWQVEPDARVTILHLVSRTLRHLAHLYDTHPDYQQEWRLWSE